MNKFPDDGDPLAPHPLSYAKSKWCFSPKNGFAVVKGGNPKSSECYSCFCKKLLLYRYENALPWKTPSSPQRRTKSTLWDQSRHLCRDQPERRHPTQSYTTRSTPALIRHYCTRPTHNHTRLDPTPGTIPSLSGPPRLLCRKASCVEPL